MKTLKAEHDIKQTMKAEQLALGGEQYVLGLVCQVYRSIGVPLDMLLKYYSACEGLQIDISMQPEVLLFNIIRPFMSPTQDPKAIDLMMNSNFYNIDSA